MHQAERLGVVLEELSSSGSVSVTELCERLGVSAATIRRDLELLEEQRLLTRTHGGAVAQMVSYELPLRYRSARRQEQKRRVGVVGDLNLDVVFIGSDGISASAGLTTHHEVEAHTDRAVMDRAANVVVVADSSKLGRTAFVQICPIDAVHELVTDDEGDRGELAAIRERGVGVTVV